MWLLRMSEWLEWWDLTRKINRYCWACIRSTSCISCTDRGFYFRIFILSSLLRVRVAVIPPPPATPKPNVLLLVHPVQSIVILVLQRAAAHLTDT